MSFYLSKLFIMINSFKFTKEQNKKRNKANFYMIVFF